MEVQIADLFFLTPEKNKIKRHTQDLMITQKEFKTNDEMAFCAMRDIAKHNITGAYIYLLIWFAIVIPHKTYIHKPDFFLWFTLVLILMAATRIGLLFNFVKIYSYSPKLWKITFFPTVWLAALFWGTLCSVSLIDPTFDSISLVIIISTAGLTGAGVAALLPSRILTIGLITAFLLPSELVLIFSELNNPSLTIVFILYWIGIYVITKTQHRAYWQSLQQSFVIREHAAELEKLNTLDGLTGLKNRTFFDKSLRKELKRAIRKQFHLSLLLIDIDFFKQVNDRHGHLVGDDCLRHLTQLLSKHAKRETDTVARYGGEEFVIILPDDDGEKAFNMAEKIRKAVEDSSFLHGKIEIPLTVSIGISSTIPKPGHSEEQIIELADIALYTAKNNGRNQVVI